MDQREKHDRDTLAQMAATIAAGSISRYQIRTNLSPAGSSDSGFEIAVRNALVDEAVEIARQIWNRTHLEKRDENLTAPPHGAK
jgi:hypothetical protein